MPAMELMAAMGLAGMEVFRYNRENFEFDQEQRFTKDEVRLKMQVELFNLFREDIRDLVELTTSKMNLYHLVGALFLKMICIFFCEGFFEAAVPPFLLSFYYVSQGCSAVYLLFAVWLSMHASVSSHSYSTRLLTRFVRLPIPGSEQINVLNARYADFERQGKQMLRVPFMKDKNKWVDRPEMEGAAKAKQAADGQAKGPAGTPDTVAADFLGQGAFAYGGDQDMLGYEQELLKAVEFRTQRHIQLFRRLQAQWQCYDAYARVCMSLGIRMMLQGTSYYLLGLCWVQVDMPYVASVVALVFQALALNIAMLDIHGVNDLSLIGALPCFCGILTLAVASRRINGRLQPDQRYLLSLMMYPLEVLWFELLHWLASPMGDNGFLPRQFRAVLFMDVFSDLNEYGGLSEQERSLVERSSVEVQKALDKARSALRKWEAVPRRWLTLSQYRLRKQAQHSYNAAADTLVDFMEKHHLPVPTEDDRPWEEYPTPLRRDDPFAGMVLGPFNHWVHTGVSSRYHWDIEGLFTQARGGVLFEKPQGARVLDLEGVLSVVKDFKRQVEGITQGFVDETTQSDSESDAGSFVGSGSEHALLTGRRADRKQAEIEVNRLPWNLVSFITRAQQMVWVGLGVMAALRETDALVVDFTRSYIVERRRLQEDLNFVDMEVSWPYGDFFQLEHLSCPSELLVSSPFAHYALQADAGAVKLREQELSAGRLLDGAFHLAATQHGRELVLKNASETVTLGLPNATRFLSGSVVPCESRWCLQLVLQGSQQLLMERAPLRSGRSVRYAELKLENSQAEQLVDAQAQEDEIWLLFSSGRLEQWKMSTGLADRRYHARDGGATAVRLCEGRLYLATRTSRGPSLRAAELTT